MIYPAECLGFWGLGPLHIFKAATSFRPALSEFRRVVGLGHEV